MPTQHKSTVFRLALPMVALLSVSIAGSQSIETADDQVKAAPGKPVPLLVRRGYDTKITVYREGSPVVVPVSVRKISLGGNLKGFSEFDVNDGPTLVQLRAGEMSLIVDDREVDLDEGDYRLLRAGERLVVTTDDDTAIIQYVSVGLR